MSLWRHFYVTQLVEIVTFHVSIIESNWIELNRIEFAKLDWIQSSWSWRPRASGIDFSRRNWLIVFSIDSCRKLYWFYLQPSTCIPLCFIIRPHFSLFFLSDLLTKDLHAALSIRLKRGKEKMISFCWIFLSFQLFSSQLLFPPCRNCKEQLSRNMLY